MDVSENNNFFYTISNGDGKKWSIPCKNSAMGFEIYEPSGIKGKLLKKCCFLLKFSYFRKLGKVKMESIILDDDISKIIQQYFGEQYQTSLFYGTPSTDQKTTIQVFKDKSILGYVKIGSSERISSLFNHEYEILRHLEKQGVSHVPKALYYGNVGAKYVFVQTTEKTNQSCIIHEYGGRHERFLKQLFEKTKQKMIFNDTFLFQLLSKTVEDSKKLGLSIYETVLEAFKEIMIKYDGTEVIWGTVHGDFTPWNTCVTDGSLFAFDFEYSLKNGPSRIDYWHFLIQCLVYERKMSDLEIIAYLLKREDVKNHSSNSYYELLIYLLYFMSIYLLRGQPTDIAIVRSRAAILAGLIPKKE